MASGKLMEPIAPIDPKNQRFPYCIVWTPLPLISWLFPPIGHMGIATSEGVIYDFGGPYYIAEDRMTFGKPTRYYQLSPARVQALDWDKAVQDANEEYRKRMHNLCCDNCHSHVAFALNKMHYRGKQSWNMFILGVETFFFGSFVSFVGFLKTWVPFLVLMGFIIGMSMMAKTTN
eukprot:m.339494 g.339494  ORF g.339494 m.339494 type:complete len:175 (+) comp18831_c0_seq1:78-602(+)